MRKYLLIPAIALLVAAGQAWSIDIEGMSGEYVGKVIDAKGVAPNKGDTCPVSIDPEGIGNTVAFKLKVAPSVIYVERNEVERGLKTGSPQVKLSTRSQKGRKIIVVLKVEGERLHFIRVKSIAGGQVRWTIACGTLAKT